VENYFAMTMDKGQVDGISALGLAHMGDGVFELLVRSWLCGHGRTKVQNLHRETVSYVSAPAQARFVERLEPLPSPEEHDASRRGRDAPPDSRRTGRMNAKNTHIRTIVPTGPMPRRRFLRIKPPPSRITLHSTWIRLLRQAQLYICSLEL